MRNLIAPPTTRLEAIKLMTEISQISLKDEEESQQNLFKEKTCMYFCLFIEQIANVTKNRDLREEYQNLVRTKQQTYYETFCK